MSLSGVFRTQAKNSNILVRVVGSRRVLNFFTVSGSLLQHLSKICSFNVSNSSSGEDVALWPRQPRFESWIGQFLKWPTLQMRDSSALFVVNAGSPKKSSPAAGLKYAAMGSDLLRKRSSGIGRARRVLSIPHGFGRFRRFYKKLQPKSACGSVSEWLRRCT